MFSFLRKSESVLVLPDEEAFWRHCDETQRWGQTPDGPAADAKERLDLAAGVALKELLEAEVGPEEGPSAVQMQNWDWNDDRCRGVYILRHAFKPELIPKLQAFLSGDFGDFQIIISLLDSWGAASWGHLKVTSSQVAVQRNVAQAYSMVSP